MQTILNFEIDNDRIITYNINSEILIETSEVERLIMIGKLEQLKFIILQLNEELLEATEEDMQKLRIKILTDNLEKL